MASQIKLSKSYWMKAAVTIIIPLILILIPQTEIYTPAMKWFLALTVGMLLWAAFDLTDLLIPSLLWPILLILLNIVPATVIYSSWLSLVVPCCVSAILLAGVLGRIGLLKRLTYWIVWKCGGSFTRTMYALYFACLIVSAITFAGASTIIAALCYGMAAALKMENKEEAAITMMVGMLAASTCRMFIYQPLTAALVTGSVEGIDPSFALTAIDMFKHNWTVIIYSVLCIFIFTKIAGTKHSSISGSKDYFEHEYNAMGKMTMDEKKGAAILIFLILGIFTNPWHHIDGMMFFVFAFCLCYLPGINIGSAQEIKNAPIGTFFFIAACMAIGAGCTATGVTAALSAKLTPILANLSSNMALFMIMIIGIILNLIMTPMAMVSAFSGPLVALTAPLGLNAHAVVYSFLFSTDMVFLPYEYVTFLIFFSFGVMTNKQFIKYHTIKNILFLGFFWVAIIPYWALISLI